MKFKRRITAICASALALGATFLLYPQFTDKQTHSPLPTPTPALVQNTPTNTPVPTKAPTATPEPTKPPLFTAEFITPDEGVTELVTSYITAYYGNDFDDLSTLVTDATVLNPITIANNTEGVKTVEDIVLYEKPGINEVDAVIYATYTLSYGNTRVGTPQFSEYHVVTAEDGSLKINTSTLSSETQSILAEARKQEDILMLSVTSLIKRYNNACLNGDEPLLRRCVTDADYLDMEYLASRFAYTENFSDYEFTFRPGINEFDYLVYVTYKEKIVLIDTAAPCMECYCISINPSAQPLVYLGITSLDTDAYCAAVNQSDEIQALAVKTNQAMEDALLEDDDLKEFYNHLVGSNG